MAEKQASSVEFDEDVRGFRNRSPACARAVSIADIAGSGKFSTVDLFRISNAASMAAAAGRAAQSCELCSGTAEDVDGRFVWESLRLSDWLSIDIIE